MTECRQGSQATWTTDFGHKGPVTWAGALHTSGLGAPGRLPDTQARWHSWLPPSSGMFLGWTPGCQCGHKCERHCTQNLQGLSTHGAWAQRSAGSQRLSKHSLVLMHTDLAPYHLQPMPNGNNHELEGARVECHLQLSRPPASARTTGPVVAPPPTPASASLEIPLLQRKDTYNSARE